MEWYIGVLKKYAEFNGRARRTEYWMFVLINFGISIVLSIIEGTLGFATESNVTVLSGLYSLAVLVPSLAVGVRRLHDTDRSGWWLLLAIVPLANIVLLYFLILEGTRGPNQYGPDPKSAEPAFGAPAIPGYAVPPAPPAPPAPPMPPMAPMTAAPALPAAGWLPDPTERHELRYWDGSQWTEHVSGGGVTGTDPL